MVSLLLLSGGSFCHDVLASEPVPVLKPVDALTGEPFVEGVDIPPAKPQFGEAQPAEAKETASEGGDDPDQRPECDIPGALVEAGEPVESKPDDDKECGIADPVRLAGVVVGTNAAKFPAPLTISCEFAGKLTGWLRKDVLPAARDQFDSPVSVLVTGPGYQCRRRNNQPDGKLSEHALGKAVDISQFQLINGETVSVEADWGADTKKGRFLKTIHALACRRFTTVLGPDADANHRSHFHLDIGCHGKTCTYLICQ